MGLTRRCSRGPTGWPGLAMSQRPRSGHCDGGVGAEEAGGGPPRWPRLGTPGEGEPFRRGTRGRSTGGRGASLLVPVTLFPWHEPSLLLFFGLLNPDLVGGADVARVPVEPRAAWER